MVNDLVMPKLGLTMTEGVLAEWQIAPGDKVKAGQTLFVVETDKIATEIEAASDGEILELLAQAGDTLAVGAVVGRWIGGGNGAGTATDSLRTAAAAEPLAKPAMGSEPNAQQRIVATPLARRIARQQGVDLGFIEGSGPRGRIKAKDVEQHHAMKSAPPFATASSSASRRKEPTSLQLTVARRMSTSKRDIPHFYLAGEANLGPLIALRAQLNADRDHVKLSINHFILAAVTRAWAASPDANRVWTDDGFQLLATVDVGFAVDTPRGLFAPVIRDAASMSIDTLAACADATASRAREGKLTGDEMSGGAVTVSNVGMHSVTYLTPIINPGQSAIVGVGTIRSICRPDDNDQPVARREVGLVLACDHRVFNGIAAARLLEAIVNLLEKPLRLLRNRPRED